MDANVDDASDEFMEEESIPPTVEEGCEVTGEIPLLSLEPEQGVPEVDPEVETPTTSSDTVKVRPRAEIPSPVAPIGKSSFVTLPMGHDISSRPMEKSESSSGSSLQFAKNVPAHVLNSWIETLFSGHLDAGFGMIQHVQEILSDTKGVGLDVTGARAIVDRIIALDDKWFETMDFPDSEFFKEMFLDPASKAKSDMDETTQSMKQFVRERNLKELAIIGLRHNINILDSQPTS